MTQDRYASRLLQTPLYALVLMICVQAGRPTDLLDGKLQQLWQAGRQHADEKRRGRAADVQHAGRQHGNEGVLPGEGVQQRQHRVATPR